MIYVVVLTFRGFQIESYTIFSDKGAEKSINDLHITSVIYSQLCRFCKIIISIQTSTHSKPNRRMQLRTYYILVLTES